jgi:hypothetical protein
VPARHLVGGGISLLIQKLSHQAAALHPPLVPVDEEGGVPGHPGERLRGLERPVLPAQEERAGEAVGGILPQVLRHRLEGLLGGAPAAVCCDAGLGEEHVIASGPGGRAKGGAPALLEQEPLHAEAMVGPGQNLAENVQDLGLGFGAEGVFAPGLARERIRLVARTFCLECKGEGDAPRGGGGRVIPEELADEGEGLASAEERLLGAAANLRRDRPVGVCLLERVDAVEGEGRAAADGEPVHERQRRRVRQLRPEGLALFEVAFAERLDGLLEGLLFRGELRSGGPRRQSHERLVVGGRNLHPAGLRAGSRHRLRGLALDLHLALRDFRRLPGLAAKGRLRHHTARRRADALPPRRGFGFRGRRRTVPRAAQARSRAMRRASNLMAIPPRRTFARILGYLA